MAGHPRVFSREFKEAAVHRIVAGEKVRALAAELQVAPKLLYHWWNRYEQGGPEALISPGRRLRLAVWAERPRPVLGARSRRARKAKTKRRPAGGDAESKKIAALERKIGQQAVELDFFARALRHIRASAPPSDGPGARASSP
jgi:transposase-like protein